MKQLIFDCDGVLIDSEIIAAKAMVDELNYYEIPITIGQYLTNCTGKTFSGLKTILSDQYQMPLPDNFVQKVTSNMERLKLKQLRPIEGILDLLDNVTHFPKAVVSNSDLGQIQSSLTQVDALHYFGPNIYSSEQVQNPKPSPEIYLFAAENLGVNPKDCLVIEDSISGATAALSADMQVVGLLAGSHIVEGHEDRLRNVGVKMMAYNTRELKEIIDLKFEV